MSIDTALARIEQLNALLAPRPVAPPSPPAAAAPAAAAGGGDFASALAAASAPQPAAGAGAPAAPGTYPHLSGDLDADPEILSRLEALAASRGERFHINSGLRTLEEQQRLWDNRHSNPNPVAPPGRSRHHHGEAADVSIGGRPIQAVIPAAELRRFGLVPLPGDPPHVELPR